MYYLQEKPSKLIIAMRVIFSIATIATIIFIFSNSAEIGEISGGKSAVVTTWINNIVANSSSGFRISEGFIRKLAHVSEYALLGFCLMLTLRVYTRRIIAFICYPLFFGLLIPVCDESLQTFIPGRLGCLKDVVIDFFGFSIGIFCGLFLLLLLRMFSVMRKTTYSPNKNQLYKKDN